MGWRRGKGRKEEEEDDGGGEEEVIVGFVGMGRREEGEGTQRRQRREGQCRRRGEWQVGFV